jgi:hypothetical protein
MVRFRLLLLPFGAVAEAAVLGLCLLLAWASPSRAEKLLGWATGALPTLNWYIGE